MSEATATQDKKDTRKRVIQLEKTVPHPVNRDFSMTSPEWEDFVQSISEHGVIQPPMLRMLGDSQFQIIFGHRRIAAAKSLGMDRLDCLVAHMTEREALELLLIENLQRENPDPVEEAKLVAEMAKLKMSPEEIAQRVSRSVEWVTTRQGMLDLGPEVLAAVRLPKEDERHLSIGTVQLMLQLDPADRAQAVQLVLHPEFKLGALNTREASDVLRSHLLEPRERRKRWEAGSTKVAKAWRKRLGDLLTKEEKKSLVVHVVAWDEVDSTKARRRAEDGLAETIPAEMLNEIPMDAAWLHLAIKHEQPVVIVPADNEGGSEAMVNESLLKLAENSNEEHGVVVWIRSKRRPEGARVGDVGSSPPSTGSSGVDEDKDAGRETSAPSGEDRVQDALHVLDGEGERGYQEEEKVTTVIEQRVESGAWVNLMPVRRMREYAVKQKEAFDAGEDFDDSFPEGMMPAWMDAWSFGFEDVIAVCDWVLSLNSNPGGGR